MDFSKIAEKEGLDIIETTSGSNGYPSNLGKALIGFESFEKVEELAIKYNLEIAQFNKKDGWHFWFRAGSGVYEPFNNSAADYGDNYDEFQKMEESEFIEKEVKFFFDDDRESFEEIEAFLKQKKEIWQEIEKMNDGEIVITYEGRYYETIQKQSMAFYYDTKHTVIGLQEK
jgi:hypothetical protein